MSDPRSYYLGIDPGKDGGLALVDQDDRLSAGQLWKTPIIPGERDEYDVSQMRHLLVLVKNQVRMDFHGAAVTAIIEKQHAFPRRGVTNFSTGYGFGLWTGLLLGVGVPYQAVNCQTWQKRMLEGVKAKDTKQGSISAALRRWPKITFRKSPEAKKPDHGLTDAALLASFGRLSFGLLREIGAGAPR